MARRKKSLLTKDFVTFLRTKAVEDASGHRHDEGNGQFTSGGGGSVNKEESKSKKPSPKAQEAVRESSSPATSHEHIRQALAKEMRQAGTAQHGGSLADVYGRARVAAGGKLSVADFHRDLLDLEQKGELHLEASGKPDYFGNAVERGGKVLDIVRPGPGPNAKPTATDVPPEMQKPVEPSQNNKPAAPATFTSSMEKWAAQLSNFGGGVAQTTDLYRHMRRDLPDLTPEQFHDEIESLWKAKKIEMHVLNEVHTLTPEQRKLGFEHNGKYYGFVRLKPSKP